MQNWPGGGLTKLIGKLLTSGWAPVQNWDQIHLGDGWCSGDKTNLCVVVFSCPCALTSTCSLPSRKSITGIQSDFDSIRSTLDDDSRYRGSEKCVNTCAHVSLVIMQSSLNKPVRS